MREGEREGEGREEEREKRSNHKSRSLELKMKRKMNVTCGIRSKRLHPAKIDIGLYLSKTTGHDNSKRGTVRLVQTLAVQKGAYALDQYLHLLHCDFT